VLFRSLWGINGAAWATVAGFYVATILNVISVEKLLGRTLKTRTMILKPVAAALAMVGVILLIRQYLFPHPAHPAVFTIAYIAVGGGVYGLAMLLLGGVRREELALVPGLGRPLAGLLERVGLLR
jgi:O-antigen/teichoic acid export membrane protein